MTEKLKRLKRDPEKKRLTDRSQNLAKQVKEALTAENCENIPIFL